MDAILNFKQAAKALQEDERYLALVAARKANDEDAGLQKQIEDFNATRLLLSNEMNLDDKDEERVAELNLRVNQQYTDIMQNKSMLAYNKAKEDIESFMEYVNAILNAAIDGKDPMEAEEPAQEACGCGAGGCAGCSGC